jgi:hypothetical protein
MEHSEETALDTAEHKQAKWLRCSDDTSVVWPHKPARLQQLFYHLRSVRSTIKFKMEVNANDNLLFLDFFLRKRGHKLASEVYRKPTHTDRYLNFNSNHPLHLNREVVHGLISRPKVKCQKDLYKKIESIRQDLKLNEYPQEFADSIIRKAMEKKQPSFFRYDIQRHNRVPYVKGIFEKLRCTGSRFKIRITFKLNIHCVRHR